MALQLNTSKSQIGLRGFELRMAYNGHDDGYRHLLVQKPCDKGGSQVMGFELRDAEPQPT